MYKNDTTEHAIDAGDYVRPTAAIRRLVRSLDTPVHRRHVFAGFPPIAESGIKAALTT